MHDAEGKGRAEAPVQPLFGIHIPELSEFVSPDRRLPEDAGVAIRESDVEVLEDHAKAGHGGAQLALFLLSKLTSQLDYPIMRRIDDLACNLSKKGHIVATEHCAWSLLRSGKSSEEIENGAVLFESLMGFGELKIPVPVGEKDCAPPGWEACWEAFKPENKALPAIQRLLALAALMERKRPKNLSEMHWLVEGLKSSQRAPETRWWLSRIVERIPWEDKIPSDLTVATTEGIETLKTLGVPSEAEYYARSLKCTLDKDEAACLVLSTRWGDDPRFARDRSPFLLVQAGLEICSSDRRHWEMVLRSGYSPGKNSPATCFATGEGGPSDFQLATQLARLYFISGRTIAAKDFAVLLALPEYGNGDLETAYFALELNRVDVRSRLGELDSRALRENLDPSRVRELQRRVSAWDRSVDSSSFRSDTRGEIIQVLSWLDFFSALPLDFTGNAAHRSERSGQAVQGTGFLIGEDGFVLTNAHVVESCDSVRQSSSQELLQVVAIDKANDLAVLKGAPRPGLSMSRGKLRLGEEVSALGFPAGSVASGQFVATTGTVTALAGPNGDSRLFQLSAPVHPGNSGGPVVDSSGNVVGVVVATADARRVLEETGVLPQGMNFAIRASAAIGILETASVDVEFGEGTGSMADAIDLARASVLRIACDGGEPHRR